MSLNNVIPWWMLELQQEILTASMSCAFEEELLSGTFHAVPREVRGIVPSDFKSWEPHGWNALKHVQ
jgi:hypothetical protein